MPSPLALATLEEIVTLGATNSEVFTHHFFPKTVRQRADFDPIIWGALEDPSVRYVNLRCFRGSGKTSRLRLFAAKRIAYGLSRTILYIGASEPHAQRSVDWIRKAVTRNRAYASAFGLSPGTKWNETEIEINHKLLQQPIWVLGAGITGNVRGINFDDYRPDLIILDDTVTDENAATLEQREKISDLILGALKEGLAPATEEPNAKLVNLQTPLNVDDATARMEQSELFHTITVSCWSEATRELDVEHQESSWPERYPTAILRQEKLAAMKENRYSKWAREMECVLVSAELATFRAPWLGRWTTAPRMASTVLVIDPVPPPSARQMAKALKGKDYEAHVVVGRSEDKFYALEVRVSREHQPTWTLATALELARKWRVMRICIIAVGYEIVLEGMFRTEMARRRDYHAVHILPTRNKEKFARITSNLAGPASAGKIYVNASQTNLIAQFGAYGPTYSGHDDELEAFAAGVGELTNPYLEAGGDAEDMQETDDGDGGFVYARGAP